MEWKSSNLFLLIHYAVSYLYNYFLKEENKKLYFYDGSQAYVRDKNKVLIAGKEDDKGNIIEYYSYKTIEGKEFIKKQLNSGKPVIISGSSSSGDYIGPHYVLAVGYYNDGNNQSDYIIIDTEGIYIDGVYNKGSGTERMDIFYEHFPDETGKKGYKYMLY